MKLLNDANNLVMTQEVTAQVKAWMQDYEFHVESELLEFEDDYGIVEFRFFQIKPDGQNEGDSFFNVRIDFESRIAQVETSEECFENLTEAVMWRMAYFNKLS